MPDQEYEKKIRAPRKMLCLKTQIDVTAVLLIVLIQWGVRIGHDLAVLHKKCSMLLPRNELHFLLNLNVLHLSIVRGAGLG
jgi:hypothetical protein